MRTSKDFNKGSSEGVVEEVDKNKKESIEERADSNNRCEESYDFVNSFPDWYIAISDEIDSYLENDLYEEMSKNLSNVADEIEFEAKGRIKSDVQVEVVEVVKEVEKEIVPKNNRKKKIVIGIIFAVFIVAILIVSYFLLKDANAGRKRLETLKADVLNLYTSDVKEDVRDWVKSSDVSRYLVLLESLEESEPDLKSEIDLLKKELNGISFYIADDSLLSDYERSDYDISVEGFLDRLSGLDSNVSKYSELGLAMTIKDRIVDLEDEYKLYNSILNELESLDEEGIKSFDEQVYIEQVEKISHTVNADELLTKINEVIAEKAILKEKEDENKKAEEDKKKAEEEALKKAEEKRKEAEKLVDELEKKLEEELKNKPTVAPTEKLTVEPTAEATEKPTEKPIDDVVGTTEPYEDLLNTNDPLRGTVPH